MDIELNDRKLNDNLFNRLLKNKGVTQKKMAKDLKINEKTMSLYKANLDKFSDDEAKSIAKYLGTTVDELWVASTSPTSDLATLTATVRVLTLLVTELQMKATGKSLVEVTQEIDKLIKNEEGKV